MKLCSKLLLLAGVAVFAGCAQLDKAMQDMQAMTAPPQVKETLPQICQAAKDNPVRANGLYANKSLAISGEVAAINEGFQPRYRVFLRAGKINVHAGTDNQLAVKQLTVGRVAQVVGTITAVSLDYQGCSVALKDARF